jgi:tetratricopeptide (TPR) repeat protein
MLHWRHLMKHLLIVIALALTSSFAWGCHARAATPNTQPETPGCAAALAPGRIENDSDRAIVRAQDEARRDASARAALERLGDLYIARARTRNDPGDYKLAEVAAECLGAKYPEDATALLLKGHVLHQLHRFREAEQIARSLVARRTFVLDFGLLGDALMEQGHLDEAANAYQRMIDLKPFYQSYTRAAHLRWLKGDLDGAIELMRLAIASAGARDPEASAWAWTRLATYELQAARFDEAATAAERALTYQADYAAALLAQGRILLATNRPGDALKVLRRAASLNAAPEYQWILADALRLEGLGAEADVIERELMTRGSTADPRTFALFLATRRIEPGKALSLTEDELRARADVFTLDAHAWALAANGRIDDAAGEMTRALREGTRDARLFLHAAVINRAAGRHRDAARWFARAVRLKSQLFPSESIELTKHLAPTH